MTINIADNSPRVSYDVAEGVTQSSFTVSFEFFDNEDLNVYVDGVLKTLTTDYTVTGGDGSTGTVTISVTGATGGSTVVITRDIDLERTTDFPASGAFNIATLNTELDRLIAIAADLEDLAGRGVKLADFDTQAALTLPLASERGNKVLAFNADGDTLVSQELGTFKGDWAASTAYVERDLVKDTTTNNVFIVTSAHTSSGSLPLTTNTNSDKYEKIIDITNPPGDVTFGGSITTSSSVTAGSFVIGSADINENDLEAIDSVTAGTVAASKAVVVDVNKDISSFRNLTATGDITFGGLSDGTITVTAFVDEDNMASDSATLVPTQQSVKAYVDSQIGANDALSEILGNGNTSGGTNIQMTTTDELQFRDTALKISSSADGQLDIDADTEVEITAPTVDINASTEVNISGAAKIGGTLNIDTIDELTTDAGTTINSTFIGNNKIGIGTSVVGDTQVAIRGSAAKLRLESTSAGNHNWDVGVFSTSFRIYHQATGQNPLWIDSSDNVGIGTISPSTKLDVNGTVTADGLTVDGLAKIQGSAMGLVLNETDTTDLNTYFNNNGGVLKLFTVNDAFSSFTERLRIDHSTGDISFYEDTGTTAKFFWDASAERLELGGDLILDDGVGRITLDSISGANRLMSTTTGFAAYEDLEFRADNYLFKGGTTERMRIDSSGNVGIGATTVGAKLHLEDSGTGVVFLKTENTAGALLVGNNSAGNSYVSARTTGKPLIFETQSAEAMRIDSSGRVGIGTSSPDTELHVEADTPVFRLTNPQSTSSLGLSMGKIEWETRDSSASGVIAHIDVVDSNNFGTTFDMAFATGQSGSATERMRIDSSGNVGIGTSSPSGPFHVVDGRDELSFTNGSNNVYLSLTAGYNTKNSVLNFYNTSDAGYGRIDYDHATEYMAFHANSAEAMRIDSSGRLLLGTTTAGVGGADEFTVAGSGATGITIRSGTTSTSNLYFADGTSGNAQYRGYVYYNHDTDVLGLGVSAFEAVRIDSSGRVGIGTTSPSQQLHVYRNTTDGSAASLKLENAGATASYATLDATAGTVQTFLYSDAAGNALGVAGATLRTVSNHPLIFGTNNTETMRIDSGNLLVGKTSGALGTAGSAFYNYGLVESVRDGNKVMTLNRLTSDGDILEFRKDGTTVGSIGVYSTGTRIYLGTGDTGLVFGHDVGSGDAIFPINPSTNLGRDNAIDLGVSGARFDDIHATNGTIQTSDRNEKQDIAELTDAEQRVAVAAKGLLRKFRWKNAVAEKGDEARTHFGIIAQDLQAAFAAEGLDAGDYAMFIHSTWTDEETGEERSRMGVRYSELLAFIIAAI
jgi:hypothetical protein